MKKFLSTSLLLGAALVPTLQGCLPMVAAGATSGALATMDRRSLGTQTDDETIEWKASARVNEKSGDQSHTNFTSYNRKVLITGEVPSEDMKTEIGRIVSAVPQVKGIYNELAVGPVASYSARSNDSYITSRVKGRFIDSGQFNAVHVKVITEAGVVYLLGLVSQREADAAVQVARTTTGVKKVVSLLEIVADDKANSPAPKPAENGG
jgi:osmotically-inducible protein OsmY